MIDITARDGCATITLADLRPLTQHDPALANALRDAVVQSADDDDVKAIVIRSAEEDFCGPAGVPASRPHWAEVWTDFNQAFTASSALYQSVAFAKKVIITEVAGQCTGAGSLLVLCSDLTVASDTASLASPFATLPESNFVLAALTMRLNRAKAWLLSETALSADIAVEYGLVNRVVPYDLLKSATDALAASVTRMPLDGITMSKMIMQSVLDAHGVGREFDMAGFYANAMWSAKNDA